MTQRIRLIATIEGPFGEIEQMSPWMSFGEAMVTLQTVVPEGVPPPPRKGMQAWLKGVHLVVVMPPVHERKATTP